MFSTLVLILLGVMIGEIVKPSRFVAPTLRFAGDVVKFAANKVASALRFGGRVVETVADETADAVVFIGSGLGRAVKAAGRVGWKVLRGFGRIVRFLLVGTAFVVIGFVLGVALVITSVLGVVNGFGNWVTDKLDSLHVWIGRKLL